MMQRVFLGPVKVVAYHHDTHSFSAWDHVSDINGRELFTLIPLAVIIVIIGVYPSPAIDMIRESMAQLLKAVQ